tara:strand:+ start:13056 stop:13970 length:915 start_codon:yes stop_codon:yes gene_type:complete
MKGRPYFTIFTPCYNSEQFIQRVYESLCEQEFKDFEWLLVEDCSTDDTLEILKGFQGKGNLNVTIIKNETNQFLSENFNIAVAQAQGEFFIPLGHDDRFHDEKGLQLIWEECEKIVDNEKVAGVWTKCITQSGKLVGKDGPADYEIANFFDVFEKYVWQVEWFPCYKTDILKDYPFYTDQLRYYPEGLVWGRIAKKYELLFSSKVTRTYFVNENANALTKRSRSQVAQAVVEQQKVWINDFLQEADFSFKFRVRMVLSYTLHSVILKIKYSNVVLDLKPLKYRVAASVLFPLVVLASRLKLVKT